MWQGLTKMLELWSWETPFLCQWTILSAWNGSVTSPQGFSFTGGWAHNVLLQTKGENLVYPVLASYPLSPVLPPLSHLPVSALFGSCADTHHLTKREKKSGFFPWATFPLFWWTKLADGRAPLASVFWPTETAELEQHTSIPLQRWEKRLGQCAPCSLSFHSLTKVCLLLLLHLKDGGRLILCFI